MSDQVSDKDEMKEIIDEFIVEAYDLAEKATQDIITIENNPDEEAINSIFRAVHTVKGTSSFLGFDVLSTLAHRAEDILGMVRKGNMAPDHAVGDALLEALDLIKTLLEEIKESGAEQSDTAPTIEKLEALKNPAKEELGGRVKKQAPSRRTSCRMSQKNRKEHRRARSRRRSSSRGRSHAKIR